MTPADDIIARAARAVRPVLIARAAETGGTVTPPGEAEIALTIRALLDRAHPGTVTEDHDLVVDWSKPGEIRILLAVAALAVKEWTA